MQGKNCMFKFLASWEFLISLIVFAILLKWFGLSDLANYVQVSQIFAWAYIIYRLHKHHKLIKSLMDDEESPSK